jgi:hypothetical protein
MFLYYFDADIGHCDGSGEASPPQPSQELQTELNEAVRSGGRKTTAPRSSLNLFSPTSNAAPHSDDTQSGDKFSTLQPTGIIDLECYTSVHRSPTNPLILELAGDDSVNPDLRCFYFCASSDENSDDWTQAFLGGRHASLIDERDAYKQVCDGFSQQLQQLHHDLDVMEKRHSDSEEECYRIRSNQEEVRRSCFRLIEEALERVDVSATYSQSRRAFRTDLETVRQQDMGLVPAVQLLCEFCAVLEEQCHELSERVKETEEQVRRARDGDDRHKEELDILLKTREREWTAEREAMQHKIDRLEKQLQSSKISLKDAQQDLTSQKMEFTMYQSSQKQKVHELQSHKKILKKEVIDLRSKLDEVGSELSLLKHHSKTSKQEVEQERKRTELLEKYVEKMETQVKVQQNMMELMSQGYDNASRASGSQAYNSPYNNYHKTPEQVRDVVVVNTPSSVGAEDEIMADNPGDTHSQLLRKAMADDDKSHLSELTEDRTQKQLAEEADRRRVLPTYIGVEQGHPRLDTISSTAGGSLPPRRPVIPDDARSSPSINSQSRMSVAQRARLEAEQRGGNTPIRVRPPVPMVRQKSNASQSSFLSNMARSITDVIDNSVLGVGDDDESFDSDEDSIEDDDSRFEEDENEQPPSEAGSGTLSLAERQQIQRAKQIAFLKEQGLLKDPEALRGGAGASPAKQPSS